MNDSIYTIMSCAHCMFLWKATYLREFRVWLLSLHSTPYATTFSEAADSPVCPNCGGALVDEITVAVTTETGKTLNIEQSGAVAEVDGVGAN